MNDITFKRDSFVLNYEIKGEGLPAIVIESSKYYPRTFSNNLQQKLQLIFMDHRGFSSNIEGNEEAFELAKILDDIEGLRQKLGLRQILIIGHSIHALMALEYAKKYPKAVKALIMIATSPLSGNKLHEAANMYFQEAGCPARKEALIKNLDTLDKAINANPDKAFITKMLKFAPMIWYDYNYDASKMWEGVSINKQGANIIWGKMFDNYSIESNLDNLKFPIFLALGRYDYWNPPYLWENYRSKFHNFTIRIFEKSGHTPQFEEADNFYNELLRWLEAEKIN